ncbi:MAG TPA: AraC family transcriptional regulator [Planctomycetaceae bacterium]|nr:AraC family transcriptional regulator [Planctomycetaceae bacterium]
MSDGNLDLSETHTVGRQSREWIVSPQSCPALALYHISLAGVSHASPEFRFVRPDPPMSQALVCFGGSGRVLVEGEWLSCEAGQAYITPPHRLHAYHADHGRWKVCWVTYGTDSGAPALGVTSPVLIAVDGRSLLASLECLYRETMGPADPALMQHWAALVHAHALRAAGPQTRLGPLWERVTAEPAHPWSLEELASVAGVSPEHLRRLCSREVGSSPMRYVTELRMRAAASLLASEFYTVDEIAERVGYENPFAFSTAFKRHTGVPPSRFHRRR